MRNLKEKILKPFRRCYSPSLDEHEVVAKVQPASPPQEGLSRAQSPHEVRIMFQTFVVVDHN